MEYSLVCAACGRAHSADYKKQLCECGGILEVRYASGKGLPLPNTEHKMHKINRTRLIKSKEYGNLFLKLETDNITRSFKDRGSVIEISKALDYGYDEVVCASTGNMAYSLTYFAKKAGIDATAIISNDANPNKIKDIEQLHEAKVIRANGDFTKAQKMAIEYSETHGAFLTGDYCYRKEGQKMIAYEIAARLAPSRIIVPVGNATLLSGIYKALLELKTGGKLKRVPKLIAVQAVGCCPLVDAFERHANVKYVRPRTEADAIAVGYPTFGDQAITGLRATGGNAIRIGEKDMEEERKRFYSTYRITIELASASALAAYRRIKLREGDSTVAIVTGGNV